MKIAFISLAATLIVPLLAWLGGYDFDTRGSTATQVALWSIYVFVVAYIVQYGNDKFKKP